MAGRVRHRTVWLGKVNRREATLLDTDFGSNIRAVLDPSHVTTFYRRKWRVSRPLQMDGVLAGKLGFERISTVSHSSYDEQRQDFVTVTSPEEQGNFVFYVIDLDSQVIAFEERQPDIPRTTALRIFRQMLERPDSLWHFEVDEIQDFADFETWLEEIDVVTRFTATIRRPNPSSGGHTEDVRRLLRETNADRINVDVAAPPPPQTGRSPRRRRRAQGSASQKTQGLVIADTLLGHLADHASQGNGKFKVSGHDRVSGGNRRYDSSKRLLSEVVEYEADVSEETIVTKLADAARRVADRLGLGHARV